MAEANKQQLDDTTPLRDSGRGGSASASGSSSSSSSASGNSASKPAKVPDMAETHQAIQEAAKQGTNIDTLVGRLVVDNGLATKEEVQHCLEHVKTLHQEDNSSSLMQILVDQEYVTKRQIARLRAIIEAERSGQKIPGFKVLGKIGAGAMATVFKAVQLSLDRTVAIKVLPRKFSDNPQFIERFYAEGRAAAALNHPNIVQAFDVGKAGEFHYFVMEFVDGRTVYDDIVKQKRFQETEAVEVIMQVAEALKHAHGKGLIHRDVKPKNVMITNDNVVKLADMGLARAVSDKEAAEAEAGKAFGTPYYIAPEQIRGEREIGPPADIYSLGATFYHMVTGAVPFEGKNPSSVMHKHLKAELVPPDHVNPKLSAGVSEVIERMMAKAPRDRYKHCGDLMVDLQAVRNGEQPPIAHKDVFEEADLSAIAGAETAAATDEIPVDSSGSGNVGQWIQSAFYIVLAVAGLSLLFNVLFAANIL
ncbi:MAG: serine/threonine-protein kinase [Planctomycetota bacterium]